MAKEKREEKQQIFLVNPMLNIKYLSNICFFGTFFKQDQAVEEPCPPLREETAINKAHKLLSEGAKITETTWKNFWAPSEKQHRSATDIKQL